MADSAVSGVQYYIPQSVLDDTPVSLLLISVAKSGDSQRQLSHHVYQLSTRSEAPLGQL